MGGRLAHFVSAWEEVCGNNSAVLDIIKFGFRIPFRVKPPLSTVPMFTVLPTNPVKAERIKQEVQMFLQKQAIQVVADKSSPGYYSRVFLVQKKNGKWRCIIDLSQLNLMVQLSRFKMETVASLKNAVQPGDFAVSVDLQDAYLHVPIHKSSRRYLRFAVEGTVYEHLSSVRPQQQSSSLHDGDGHSYDASKIAVRSLLFTLPGRRPSERKKQRTTAKSVELFPLTNSQIGPANQP